MQLMVLLPKKRIALLGWIYVVMSLHVLSIINGNQYEQIFEKCLLQKI